MAALPSGFLVFPPQPSPVHQKETGSDDDHQQTGDESSRRAEPDVTYLVRSLILEHLSELGFAWLCRSRISFRRPWSRLCSLSLQVLSFVCGVGCELSAAARAASAQRVAHIERCVHHSRGRNENGDDGDETNGVAIGLGDATRSVHLILHWKKQCAERPRAASPVRLAPSPAPRKRMHDRRKR